MYTYAYILVNIYRYIIFLYRYTSYMVYMYSFWIPFVTGHFFLGELFREAFLGRF